MVEFRASTVEDIPWILSIWRRAVDATHHFLKPEDLGCIAQEVEQSLPHIPMTLAVDPANGLVGFMILEDGHMDALFVDPDHHGSGIGTALVHYALAQYPRLETDVNEQNAQALRFYEKLGFQREGRSETDDQGRPYPLIHLKFQGATQVRQRAKLPAGNARGRAEAR
ncbi:MAG: acetyltransferase [Pseudomonadota bacterium]